MGLGWGWDGIFSSSVILGLVAVTAVQTFFHLINRSTAALRRCLHPLLTGGGQNLFHRPTDPLSLLYNNRSGRQQGDSHRTSTDWPAVPPNPIFTFHLLSISLRTLTELLSFPRGITAISAGTQQGLNSVSSYVPPQPHHAHKCENTQLGILLVPGWERKKQTNIFQVHAHTLCSQVQLKNQSGDIPPPPRLS